VSGNRLKVQRQNEKEAWDAAMRDQRQRDELVKAQMIERRKLQADIRKLRRKHIKDRQILTRGIAHAMRMSEQIERMQDQTRQQTRSRSDLNLTL
jgi:hypothetical protein